jgi:hypothetical protein
MVAGALALVIQERTEAADSFGLGEILILVLAFLFPAIMMVKDFKVPVGSGCLALFFGLIIRRAIYLGHADADRKPKPDPCRAQAPKTVRAQI